MSLEKLAKPRHQGKNRRKPRKDEIWGTRDKSVGDQTDKAVLGRRNSKSRDGGGNR